MDKEYTLEERLRACAQFMGMEVHREHTKGVFSFFRCKMTGKTFRPDIYYHSLMYVWAKFRDYARFNDEYPIEWESVKQRVGFSIIDDPIEESFIELSDAVIWLQSLNKETK